MAKKKRTFEESQMRLEEIIEKLSSDDFSLEESIELFKEGMDISKECDLLLKDLNDKITLISEDTAGVKTEEINEDRLRD